MVRALRDARVRGERYAGWRYGSVYGRVLGVEEIQWSVH